MRNAVSFFKHYRQVMSLSRTALLAVLLGPTCLVLSASSGRVEGDSRSPAGDRHAAAGATPQSAVPSGAPSVSSALRLPGRPDPALAAIFLPRHARPGTYRLTVIDQPIEEARATVMVAIAPGAKVDAPPGAWTVRQADPVEAFGEGGIYHRSRLSRLFAGKPAHLVRGPIERDGRAVGSVTLIAPCPDPTLARLEPATIAIVFDAAAARAR